ncbi:uncharacterized protein LOC128219889 [Mya arenaria]|uniref:uncharacterized protein LOC128219889 n=1 Tax=Mya arenaria TaxID=6604 RepID=UPI0022E49210|nr:uncharacterized protein LOC128219889 [Mya arenaria]
MNIPSRNSSSSSSDDDAKKYHVIREETHTDSHCKYRRQTGTVGYVKCEFHYRICRCQKYVDKEHLFDHEKISTQDGVEIHYTPSCQWQRLEIECFGTTFYKLQCHCNCSQPQIPHGISSMNSIAPSY